MNLLQALRAPGGSGQELAPAGDGLRDIGSLEDYAAALAGFGYGGMDYGLDPYGAGVTQTYGKEPAERIGSDFVGLAQSGFRSNGVVFACMLVRMMIFSAIRFQYQRFNNGRPSELFGDQSLQLLERPWPGGTTQDMLLRKIQDADLAGNSFIVRDTPLARLGGDDQAELVRLRPDYVTIVLAPRRLNGGQVGWRRLGYLYTEGGSSSSSGSAEPVPFLPSDVAHFAPMPDPLASYRGMSWLTPVIREVQADKLMTRHRAKFFENGATPNMVVKHPESATPEQVKAFMQMLSAQHAGVENAYKQLHVGGGADVTLVGANFQQMDFKSVQGGGETRVAAAAGVPPVIVGLSEGLQGSSLNEGNYGQARRRLADGTMHPLWANAAGSLQQIIDVPGAPGSRLWYDSRDVPFLREDSKDAANIAFIQAQTMRQLVDAGYTPDSVQRAVLSGDYGLLVHSGLFSVQLQAAGGTDPTSGQPAVRTTEDQIRELAETVQKLYLAVGVVITAEEARGLLNKAGAGLPTGLPDALAAPAAAPAPQGGTDGG
jgi:phage portal protein BeeE